MVSNKKILKFDRPVPRYTSYPTAPNFQKIEKQIHPYSDVSDEDNVSLYIHIPFCQQLCWYCGCHTKITKQYSPLSKYVDYLVKEIELLDGELNCKLHISHLHFGGGSPSMLSADDFDRIMNALKSHFVFNEGAEIAMEIDPRGVDKEKVTAYARGQVNRVSLGTQDFNEETMKAVNRVQSYEVNKAAIDLFRDANINNFNLDLIYGLPHQTPETMLRTVQMAMELKPNRISLFGYAHVPWMKKHMRLIDETTLPDREERLALFETGAKFLEKEGYVPVGIDHFAIPNDEMAQALKNNELRRNFQGYTTDQSEIMIGLGLSSIGKTKDEYLQNFVDMPLYQDAIENGQLPLVKNCQITDADKVRAKIIERLMCDFTVDLSEYDGDFQSEIARMNPYVEEGFVTIQGNIITIDKNARPIVRLVCAIFDEYLPPETVQRHSQAV